MIDVIVLNPRDVLYPWWMQRMTKDRHLFNKLIVVMTQQSREVNFTNYIKDNLDATVIEEFPDDGSDWRNAAINEALKHTQGDVLFLEQDLLFQAGFLELVFRNDHNTIGFYQGDRLHPAFLLVKRLILDKTSKDFSVDKDVGDHFSKITKELEILGDVVSLDDLAFTKGGYCHLNGLTQNYRLKSNWYDPQLFFQYNRLSMNLPQHNTWLQFCRQMDGMGSFSKHPTIDLEKYFI